MEFGKDQLFGKTETLGVLGGIKSLCAKLVSTVLDISVRKFEIGVVDSEA